MTDLTSFQVTDDVTDNLASYHNRLLGNALRTEFANTATITSTLTLSDADTPYQITNPSTGNQNVLLPATATTNHPFVIYNNGSTYNLVILDSTSTITYDTLAPTEHRYYYQINGIGWRAVQHPETKYKIAPSVSSNNLTFALQHLDGIVPSASRPLAFKINSVMRYVTAATTVTINAGTSFFNLGAVEFAAVEQQLFVYLVWHGSTVSISAARVPWGRLVSDFSATTTAETHLYNYANFTSTDDVINIGSFHVTNSGTASFNWSVPAFTSLNLQHEYHEESDWLTWTPAYSASGSLTYTSVSTTYAKYKHTPHGIRFELRASGTLGGSASTALYATVPFESIQSANSPQIAFGSTAGVAAVVYITAATPDKISFGKYDVSNYATSGSCVINAGGVYET